jgi:class 3 adenylate cyclase
MSVPHTRAVLFADVTGSVRLYEELGDELAQASIGERLGDIEAATREHGGRTVKHLGDGLMCAFAAADDAVRAAHAMQLRPTEQHGGSEIGIHVGAHYGPVLEMDGDLYGDSVNVASRIASVAKAGQIVVTRELADRLCEELRGSVRRLGNVVVRGRREPVEMFEYVWEPVEELTIIQQTLATEPVARLRVTAAGRERRLDGAGSGSLTLGRDAGSDIVIADPAASRRHARIERRRDTFVVVDHSANGTWVANAGETERCLRREELMLRFSGRIALGRPTTDPSATVIEFHCE